MKKKRYADKMPDCYIFVPFSFCCIYVLFAVQLRFSLLLSMTETKNEIKRRN